MTFLKGQKWGRGKNKTYITFFHEQIELRVAPNYIINLLINIQYVEI